MGLGVWGLGFVLAGVRLRGSYFLTFSLAMLRLVELSLRQLRRVTCYCHYSSLDDYSTWRGAGLRV